MGFHNIFGGSKSKVKINELQNHVIDLEQKNQDLYSQFIKSETDWKLINDKFHELINENNKLKNENRIENVKYEQSPEVQELDEVIAQKGRDILFLSLICVLKKLLVFRLNQQYIQVNNQRKYELDTLVSYINTFSKKHDTIKKDLIILEDELLYQEFGLYTPMYDFATSEEYKEELNKIRQMQKDMMKNNTAAICETQWSVNNSIAQGRKLTNDNIKQILRSFNVECESTIGKVKFNNYDSMKNKIFKSYCKLGQLNSSSNIAVAYEYLELKYQELALAYEYEQKKEEEKEELRVQRELRREDAKVTRELEERRREIEKEQQHYNNILLRLKDQIEAEKSEEKLILLERKIIDIKNNLVDLDNALKEVDYREANQRAGYVYIISNIGTFGEDIYKIGMTRRLDPQDRIDELGGASVPFRFDVHALIFSADAPKLESALHRAFEEKKVNSVNSRKEFFKVTLNEIEEVVKNNHDKTVDFINIPPAQQYRESLKKMGSAINILKQTQ